MDSGRSMNKIHGGGANLSLSSPPESARSPLSYASMCCRYSDLPAATKYISILNAAKHYPPMYFESQALTVIGTATGTNTMSPTFHACCVTGAIKLCASYSFRLGLAPLNVSRSMLSIFKKRSNWSWERSAQLASNTSTGVRFFIISVEVNAVFNIIPNNFAVYLTLETPETSSVPTILSGA